MNISTINQFVKEISTKDIKTNTKSEDKNTDSFKDIITSKRTEINSVNEKAKTVENNDIEDSSDSNSVITELEDKSIKLEEAIENGDKDEIVEELVDILNLLNIKIVDTTEIPLAIEIPEVQIQGLSGELVITENTTQSQNFNILENSSEDTTSVQSLLNLLGDNNSDISEEALNIIKELTGGAEDSVEKINKLIDMVLPLIKDTNGDEIKKDNIINSLVNKLQQVNVDNEDNNLGLNGLNVTSLNVNKDLNKIPYSSDGNNNFNEENTSESENGTFQNVDEKEVSDEDKILNKMLGIENTDSFAQGLNRLTRRNEFQVQSPVSSNTVFKDTMDEDILKNVKFMIRNQVQELKVKIYPKELGEMTIKILSEEGIMKAEIKATSKETYNLLNSNMNEIKKALSNENIKIQEVNIGLYSEDATYFSGQGSQEGYKNSNGNFGTNDNGTYLGEHEEEINEPIANVDSNVDLLV